MYPSKQCYLITYYDTKLHAMGSGTITRIKDYPSEKIGLEGGREGGGRSSGVTDNTEYKYRYVRVTNRR